MESWPTQSRQDVRRDYTPDEVDDDIVFRLASSKEANEKRLNSRRHRPAKRESFGPAPLHSETADTFVPRTLNTTEAQGFIEMVTVGDPGNLPDSNDFGSVDYSYRIGKYEITTAQYSQFLNAVASSPEAPLYIKDLWQEDMADPRNKEKPGKPITRTVNDDGTYSYSAVAGGENLPIAWTNWFAAARFANWLHNGATVAAGTETGAYALNGATMGTYLRQRDASFWIPSENEWYKAAYYDPAKTTDASGRASAGYWTYATQSDQLPDDSTTAVA